ncbi:hypothetical protein H0H81_011054 [Sphagnurus paluster]|uniref:Heme oxygenase n=1 Tax=Sphagnurus paluster TaxID=117069 RepID=A0A9P7FX18_9AGAR|nr:hypothetical protein H0H81_011054 [Sphagnurus paluster]
MAEIDFALPLSTLLRESTREAHEVVEKSPGAVAMLSGRLHRDEYIRYLMMLWHIYTAFEDALDRHATHPSLEPTYNPTLLARAPALAADIAFLLQVPETSWQSHPAHTTLLDNMPKALKAYVDRIHELSAAPDPSPLLAHSYVRYLGDLSGGQFIRRTLGKTYGLDDETGRGLSFYAFKELHSTKSANQGEMKRIKEWFREGMNKAGERGPDVKAAVVSEANNAFDLNTDLFNSINVDSIDTEIVEKPKPSEPVVIEFPPPEEKTYSTTQVISVIAAVCLAHFILVVGGFTGDKGYQKWLQIEQWFATLTASE